MAYLTQLDTSTLSNQNISAALLVHTWTNTTRVRKIYLGVDLDQIAGGGDYICYATVQRAGAGSAYQVSPRTTATVPAAVTAISFASIALVANATDVVKVYVIGLAGDTTTPDIIARVWEEFVNTDASGRVDLGLILGSAPTEGATGRLAAGLTKSWDVATPVWTAASVNQTGDSYARIGSAGAGLTGLGGFAAGAINNAAFATDTTLRNIRSGAVDSATSSTLVLDGSASSVNNFYDGHVVMITAGTGVNQARVIKTYTGSTKTCTLTENWATTPVGGATYVILPLGDVEVGALMPGIITATEAPLLANLDALISSRLASASYTTPPTAVAIRSEVDSNSTQLSAIKAKTDNLPASPAAVGSAMTLAGAYDAAKTAATQTSMNTVAGYIDTEVAAIKAKTDQLGFTGGLVNATATAVVDNAAIATAVDTLLSTNHGDGSWEGVDTSGPYTVTVDTAREADGTPIADVYTWIASDAAGANMVAAAWTDELGEVDDFRTASTGPFYVYRRKAGYSFVNGGTVTGV